MGRHPPKQEEQAGKPQGLFGKLDWLRQAWFGSAGLWEWSSPPAERLKGSESVAEQLPTMVGEMIGIPHAIIDELARAVGAATLVKSPGIVFDRI